MYSQLLYSVSEVRLNDCANVPLTVICWDALRRRRLSLAASVAGYRKKKTRVLQRTGVQRPETGKRCSAQEHTPPMDLGCCWRLAKPEANSNPRHAGTLALGDASAVVFCKASEEVMATLVPDEFEAGDPPPDAVRRQLERMLISSTFASSPRLSKFLRFGVEAALAGTKTLNEYTLGVDVFERDASFDPRVDPIVRVQARRLRSKLARYYATEGADDPVELVLALRSYIPAFRIRKRRRPRMEDASNPDPHSTSIAVSPFINLSPGKHCEQFAEGLQREIIDSLVNRNGWTIVSRSAGQPADAEERAARLVLLGTIRNAKKSYRLSMQLMREPDGTVLWSHMFDFEEEGVISTQEKIARSVCDQLKHHLFGSQAD